MSSSLWERKILLDSYLDLLFRYFFGKNLRDLRKSPTSQTFACVTACACLCVGTPRPTRHDAGEIYIRTNERSNERDENEPLAAAARIAERQQHHRFIARRSSVVALGGCSRGRQATIRPLAPPAPGPARLEHHPQRAALEQPAARLVVEPQRDPLGRRRHGCVDVRGRRDVQRLRGAARAKKHMVVCQSGCVRPRGASEATCPYPRGASEAHTLTRTVFRSSRRRSTERGGMRETCTGRREEVDMKQRREGATRETRRRGEVTKHRRAGR